MRYPDFVGPTYSGRSLTPASDRCFNLYVESTKGAGSPENSAVLLSTPGTSVVNILPTLPLQKLFADPSGRVFAISGQTFYEVFSNGTSTSYGTVDQGPYSFASNGIQVMFTCAATHAGFIFTLASNALTQITSSSFLTADQVVMIDNYFITRVPNSRKFQISALLDGTTWNALDFAVSEGGPDNLVGIIADHRELWLFGSRRAEVWVNTGAASFPFERINSVALEQGLAASDSVTQLDGTIYWLGQNQHGWARVFMSKNYSPVGVSNRSVEWWFNEYAKKYGISDTITFGYQDEDGHTFLVMTFPSANATWVFDVGENMWHERGYLDPVSGLMLKALSVYGVFAFGLHLVGGGDNTGNIYSLSTDVYRDNGNRIKRFRVAPHVVDELKVIRYDKLRLGVQVGDAAYTDSSFSTVKMTIDARSLPWINDNVSINTAYQFAATTSNPVYPPSVVSGLLPGDLVTVNYLSGLVSYVPGTSYDANGNPGVITGSNPAGYSPWYATKYMPGSQLGLGGLCGAFTDSFGNVIQPVSIGNTVSLIVPIGANRLQFGINDDGFFDNTGSFTIAVTCRRNTQAHLAWRVYITASQNNSEVAVNELNFYDLSGNRLTTGALGTASASTSFGGFGPGFAFDGDQNTKWNCSAAALASAPQWIAYTFTAPVAVAEFSFLLEPGAFSTVKYPTLFKLQYSDDGSNWFDVPAPSAPSSVITSTDNQVVLRASDDGGRTWSNEYAKSLGDTGNYSQVVEWRMLGRSMRRAFEISTSTDGPVCFTDAYINEKEGNQ